MFIKYFALLILLFSKSKSQTSTNILKTLKSNVSTVFQNLPQTEDGVKQIPTSTTECTPCLCCPTTTQTPLLTTLIPYTTSTTTVVTTTALTTTIATSTFAPIIYNELNCLFPFTMFGVLYDKCASFNNGKTYWCSLDRVYSTRAAKCEEACPLIARDLMANEPNSIHNSCLEPSPNVIGFFPNSNQSQIILNKHNDYRSNVQPTASDMRGVFWDIGLARLAQRWAENCIFDHDCSKCRTLLNNQTILVGQNAYALLGGNYDPDSFWQSVIDYWASESQNFQYGTGATTGNFFDVGHYTQIINSGFVKVGCGAAKCADSSIYAYCNYALGQSNIERPYESGTPCSSCSKENCRNNLCFCDKLCQNGGILDTLNCSCSCLSNFTGTLCETSLP